MYSSEDLEKVLLLVPDGGFVSWLFYLDFIGTFFAKNIFNGGRDYVNMLPNKITLATSQC